MIGKPFSEYLAEHYTPEQRAELDRVTAWQPRFMNSPLGWLASVMPEELYWRVVEPVIDRYSGFNRWAKRIEKSQR